MRGSGEQGVVAVWMAMLMVVLIAFTGWAVDYAHWNDERTHMQKAADAAALAGAVYLPDDPAGAFAAARNIAAKNGYPSGVSATIGKTTNQLKVSINASVKNSFAVAIGIGNTSLSRRATSEYESSKPLDIVLILDRTGSMATPVVNGKTPLQNAQDATRDLLRYLDPRNESIALAVLPPSDKFTTCTGVNAGALGKRSGDIATATNTWMVAPYPLTAPAKDYQNSDGTLNTSSQVVKTVNCLENAGRTDLGDPIAAATSYLNAYGRPGSKRGIILMTDGAANEPLATLQPCGYANGKATAAKAAGIQTLTIGFLSGSNTCDTSSEKTGPWVNAQVTRLLASMASPVKGVAAQDNGCNDAENKDGDNFFCQPKTGDLSSVFLQAASQLAGRLPRIVE